MCFRPPSIQPSGTGLRRPSACRRRCKPRLGRASRPAATPSSARRRVLARRWPPFWRRSTRWCARPRRADWPMRRACSMSRRCGRSPTTSKRTCSIHWTASASCCGPRVQQRPASAPGCAPAIRRPASASAWGAGRRTSSSPRPNRFISCSPAPPAGGCSPPCAPSSSMRSTRSPAPSAARISRCRWPGSTP